MDVYGSVCVDVSHIEEDNTNDTPCKMTSITEASRVTQRHAANSNQVFVESCRQLPFQSKHAFDFETECI